MTFRRARNEEQRDERRRTILDTATAMLAEMPVAEVTLTELSRRVGLAKSNVLRYFESREAVLLELLDAAVREWLGHLESALALPIPATPVAERGEQLAAVCATSLAARPVLCDLIGAQAAVLERNVSAEVAARFKRAALAGVGVLAGQARRRVPELTEPDAVRFAAAALLVTGALATHSRPSASMLAAYDADPALAVLKVDLVVTLREVLEVVLAGLLARAALQTERDVVQGVPAGTP